jgi:hypothetical protein
MKIKAEKDAHDVEIFIEKVRGMRNAQKQYFRTRDYMMLEHAKLFESEVDELLNYWEVRGMMAEEKNHPELFPAQ